MVVAAQIDRDRFYDEKGVSWLLSMPVDRIREECNRRRLRCTKRAGNRFFRGEWIIAWLEGGTGDVATDEDGGQFRV